MTEIAKKRARKTKLVPRECVLEEEEQIVASTELLEPVRTEKKTLADLLIPTLGARKSLNKRKNEQPPPKNVQNSQKVIARQPNQAENLNKLKNLKASLAIETDKKYLVVLQPVATYSKKKMPADKVTSEKSNIVTANDGNINVTTNVAQDGTSFKSRTPLNFCVNIEVEECRDDAEFSSFITDNSHLNDTSGMTIKKDNNINDKCEMTFKQENDITTIKTEPIDTVTCENISTKIKEEPIDFISYENDNTVAIKNEYNDNENDKISNITTIKEFNDTEMINNDDKNITIVKVEGGMDWEEARSQLRHTVVIPTNDNKNDDDNFNNDYYFINKNLTDKDWRLVKDPLRRQMSLIALFNDIGKYTVTSILHPVSITNSELLQSLFTFECTEVYTVKLICMDIRNKIGQIYRNEPPKDIIDDLIQKCYAKYRNEFGPMLERPSAYKCCLCVLSFINLHDFREHMRDHYESNTKFTIDIESKNQGLDANINIIAYDIKPECANIEPFCYRCYEQICPHIDKEIELKCGCKGILEDIKSHEILCLEERIQKTNEDHFKCDICSTIFLKITEYKEHFNKKHSVRSDSLILSENFCEFCLKTCCSQCVRDYLQCKYCYRFFSSKTLLDIHKKMDWSNVTCGNCDEKLNTQCQMMYHSLKHTRKFVVMICCMLCKPFTFFEGPATLQGHFNKDHNGVSILDNNDGWPLYNMMILPKWTVQNVLEKLLPLDVRKINTFEAIVNYTNLKYVEALKSELTLKSNIPHEKSQSLRLKDAEININSNAMEVQSSSNQIQSTSNQLQSSSTQIQSCSNQLQSSSTQIQSCSNQLQLSSNEIQSCSNQIQLSSNQIQSSSKQIHSKGTQFVVNSVTSLKRASDSKKNKSQDNSDIKKSTTKPKILRTTEKDKIIKTEDNSLTMYIPDIINLHYSSKMEEKSEVEKTKKSKSSKPKIYVNTKKDKIKQKNNVIAKINPEICQVLKEKQTYLQNKLSMDEDLNVQSTSSPSNIVNAPSTAEKVTFVIKEEPMDYEEGTEMDGGEELPLTVDIKEEPDGQIDTVLQTIKEEINYDEYEDDIIKLNFEPTTSLVFSDNCLYKCAYCGFEGKEDSFNLHKEIGCDTDAKTYGCSKCKQLYPSLWKYLQHLKCHGYDEMVCPGCDSRFGSREDLCRHVPYHFKKDFLKVIRPIGNEDGTSNETITYKCRKCPNRVTNNQRFQHWESHLELSGSTGYTCVTQLPRRLQKLLAKSPHDEELAPKSEGSSELVDRKLDKGTLNMLLDRLQNPEQWRPGRDKSCSVCGHKFIRNNDSKRHIIEHLLADAYCAGGPLPCQLCGNRYTGPSAYKEHMREHACLPLYKCELCHKSFSDSSNFTKHRKVHGTAAFICSYCHKKFLAKDALIKHIIEHMNSDPIKCDLCEQEFTSPSLYKKHYKLRHNKKYTKFRCARCGMRFESLKQKWDHCWLVHKERKFNADCPVCGKKYRRLYDVKNHIKSCHNSGFFNLKVGFKSKGRTETLVVYESD